MIGALITTLQGCKTFKGPEKIHLHLSSDVAGRRSSSSREGKTRKLLNRDISSSGTAEGIDVAMFLAAMATRESSFYYCDEHFSYIQSDIEKRIFGIMMDHCRRKRTA
ncbi:MAG: hypothetical protein ACLU3F_17115 [Blautia wexlerae]